MHKTTLLFSPIVFLKKRLNHIVLIASDKAATYSKPLMNKGLEAKNRTLLNFPIKVSKASDFPNSYLFYGRIPQVILIKKKYNLI